MVPALDNDVVLVVVVLLVVFFSDDEDDVQSDSFLPINQPSCFKPSDEIDIID